MPVRLARSALPRRSRRPERRRQVRKGVHRRPQVGRLRGLQRVLGRLPRKKPLPAASVHPDAGTGGGAAVHRLGKLGLLAEEGVGHVPGPQGENLRPSGTAESAAK